MGEEIEGAMQQAPQPGRQGISDEAVILRSASVRK